MGVRESLLVLWSRENNLGLRLKAWRQKSVVHNCISSLLLESWGAARYQSPGWIFCRNVRGPSMSIMATSWGAFLLSVCSSCNSPTLLLWFEWQLSPKKGINLLLDFSICNKTTQTCFGILVEKGQVLNLYVLKSGPGCRKSFASWEWDLDQRRTWWENPGDS